MNTEATRIQDLASEFSKIFRGDIPGPPQREGATPSCTHPQRGLWPGAGRKRPGVGTQTSRQLFSRGCDPDACELHVTVWRKSVLTNVICVMF